MDLFADAANHGGLWRAAYEPRSVLSLAAVLGLFVRNANSLACVLNATLRPN
jgi:hypothetical protein